MPDRLRHIILLLLFFSFTQVTAQVAMPDTVCVGATRLYHVNDATTPSTYTWKINGVTQTATGNEISITWNTAGVFQLTVQEHSAAGCDGDIRSGLVYVNPLPVANAGPDASTCFGKNIQLQGSGGTIYQWSPPNYLSNTGIANPLVILPPVGVLNYLLTVTDANGCKALKSDTVSITILPAVKIFAGRDTSVAMNQPLQLNAVDINNAGFINYTWTPSFGLNNTRIKDPVAILNRDIIYTVTAATASGCQATDDIAVKVFLGPEIYVPNAFTPNNDGLNDVIRPILVGIKELKYFAVYNRYGQEVYRTSVQTAGWDGMIKGKMQNTGTYIWSAEAIDYRGNTITRNGTVILIK
jgi:gliding motility-associated-like protein